MQYTLLSTVGCLFQTNKITVGYSVGQEVCCIMTCLQITVTFVVCKQAGKKSSKGKTVF